MPRLVGFEKSTFDPEKYRQAVCDNHGQTLTTEGICRGIENLAQEYDANPDGHWLAAMKDTPAYIRPVKNAG